MDTLITIAIFVIVAIVTSWLKKKQEPEDQSWPGQSPPPVPGRPAERPPPRSKAASWEEELRKLLEGDEPAPTPPPSVIVYEPPKPLGSPPVAPPPVTLPPRPVLRPVPVIERDEQDVGLPVQLPPLTQSVQAYQKASQLDLQVAERLRRIEQQVTHHTIAPKVEVTPPEILLAKALLRNRESLRGAIVAAVILGPPKAFEG
jgi:hypothetical protein